MATGEPQPGSNTDIKYLNLTGLSHFKDKIMTLINAKGTYSKPSGGIPKTDLTNDIQTSLGKADSALQEHQDISGKENTSNKVTSISSSSTDTQYPSARCMYDIVNPMRKYSFDEQIIGEWEDGSKIYKKTVKIQNTALSSGNNNISMTAITNFKCCIKTELTKLDGYVFPYININGSTLAITTITNVTSNSITIRCFNDSWGAGNTWYATLYYLKTTD